MSAQFPTFAAWYCYRDAAADEANNIDDAYYNDIESSIVQERGVYNQDWQIELTEAVMNCHELVS
jgi:hypothetical protein